MYFTKNKNIIILLFCTIIFLGICVRIPNIGQESEDYIYCLNNWYIDLKANGGLKALKFPIGDYNIPYVTLVALMTYLPISSLISIKIVSIFFDYILALSMFFLVREVFVENEDKDKLGIIVFTLTLFLPTVVLNSAYWAQCDSIYAVFAIISLIFLLKEKYLTSFVFLGFSFAFKLQFVFILPVYIAIYLSKRDFPFYYFFIIPIINVIMCLPGIIAGRGFVNCMKIYFLQLERYNDSISLNFPGIYNLFLKVPENTQCIPNPEGMLSKIMVLVSVGIFACMFCYIILKKVKFDKKLIIEFSVWSILTSTFFLPHMHERYMYIGEVLLIVYALIKGKKYFSLLLIAEITATCTYMYYLLFSKKNIPIEYLSILNMINLAIVTIDLLFDMKKNESVEKINILETCKEFFYIKKMDKLK